MKPWFPSKEEREAISQAIESARKIQTFLWGESRRESGLSNWIAMFRKRVDKLEQINRDNPHASVEIRKRLLQNAALSIALIGIIDRDGVPWDAKPNEEKIPEQKKESCDQNKDSIGENPHCKECGKQLEIGDWCWCHECGAPICKDHTYSTLGDDDEWKDSCLDCLHYG